LSSYQFIKSDLHRIVPGAFNFKKLFFGLGSKGFKFLFFFRVAQHTKSTGIRLICKVILHFLTLRYSFQIPLGAKIGKGFYIGHFGTIVVSRNAVIGTNCNIAHNVTIGAARGNRSGAPKIGNEVWIGTGSVITGQIIIGDNVMIAPNSFINFDIPSNSLVIGNPAKIIEKLNPTKEYINNKWQE
jgi:serine O-acetyltransferase